MSRLKKTEDTVTAKLKLMIETTTHFEQYIIKRFQPMFQRLQQKRWATENTSEGSQWEPLNPLYAAWKKIKHADSFGGGDKLMIATGRLFKSLTLADDSDDWERIITGNTVVLNFDVEYASTVSLNRPILEFSPATIKRIKDDFRDWMLQVWQLKA